MQVNEAVGQVQQGARLPDMDRAFNETRAKPGTRAERRGAEESRSTGTPLSEGIGQSLGGRGVVSGTTRVPRQYGAGF